MFRTRHKETIYSILTIIIPISFFFGVYFYKTTKENTNIKNSKILTENVLEKKIENPFQEIKIIAHSAIVKDLSTGEIIYEKNSDEVVPLASLTKIMTALVTELFNSKKQMAMISSSAIQQEGDNFLRQGESFDIKKLISFMMVASSNDGAAAVAEAVQKIQDDEPFTDKMNEVARNIGMQNTYFFNETGLDENDNQAGALGSASDMTKLLEYTLRNHPEIFEATRKNVYSTYSDNGILHKATNTNSIVSELPNLLASKTGYTDLAGGNLAVVIDPGLNKPVAIVVLGSTFEGRFEDVLKISNSLSQYYQYKNQ